MMDSSTRKVRHRSFDRLRQKLWAVPAWFRYCVLRRSSSRASSRRGRLTV